MSIQQLKKLGSFDYIVMKPKSISITVTHPSTIYKPKIDEADLSPESIMVPSITVGQIVDEYKETPLSQPYQIHINLNPDEMLVILTEGRTLLLVQPKTRNTPCPTLL